MEKNFLDWLNDLLFKKEEVQDKPQTSAPEEQRDPVFILSEFGGDVWKNINLTNLEYIEALSDQFKVDFPKKKVLDMGMGNGAYFMHLLKKHGADVTGIDALNYFQFPITQDISNRLIFKDIRDLKGYKGWFDYAVQMNHFSFSNDIDEVTRAILSKLKLKTGEFLYTSDGNVPLKPTLLKYFEELETAPLGKYLEMGRARGIKVESLELGAFGRN